MTTRFDNEARKLIKAFEEEGWVGRYSNNKWIGMSPDKSASVSVPWRLDGPNRARQNVEAALKRWRLAHPKEQPVVVEKKVVPTPATLPKPAAKQDPPETYVESPWLARRNPSQNGGVFYESHAVVERKWTSGRVEYRCSFDGCDYTAEGAVSVARHHGRKHSAGKGNITDYSKTVPGVDYLDHLTSRPYKPQQRLLDTLSDFLASQSWDNVDDLAELFLNWSHERPDLERETREVKQLTDTEIVNRIRTLIWQPVAVDLANANEQLTSVHSLLSERTAERDDANARLVAVERDLAAVSEMLETIGRVSQRHTLSESESS